MALNHQECPISQQPDKVIQEKLTLNRMLLLIAQDCPPEVSGLLKELMQSQSTSWFLQGNSGEERVSRRRVYIPWLENGPRVVVKKKDGLPSDNGLKLSYFTQSVIHELRTSFLLKDLLEQIELPQSVEYRDGEYGLTYEAQTPLAAIINLDDTAERYTVFQYIPGISARDEVAQFGGWNSTPEDKRKLFGHFHRVLSRIAPQLVALGLEPWDIGVHQLIYRANEVPQTIHLGLLDTEEYNLSRLYGSFWNEEMSLYLPAVLPFL